MYKKTRWFFVVFLFQTKTRMYSAWKKSLSIAMEASDSKQKENNHDHQRFQSVL